MDFVQVGKLVFAAQRLGDPDKPTAVLCNSLGSDARIWSELAPALLERYSLLLYDKRGHGWSDVPQGPYSIDDHTDDLFGLMDHYGIRRAALIGLSVGGLIGQSAALREPERFAALVLADTAARIGTADIWEQRVQSVEYSGLEWIANSTMERWFSGGFREQNPVAVRGWRNMLVRQPAQGFAATCAAIRDCDLRDRVHAIAIPTLCLGGTQDASTPPDAVRAMAERIPNARFEVIEGAGHLAAVEQPEVFLALVMGFLGEISW